MTFNEYSKKTRPQIEENLRSFLISKLKGSDIVFAEQGIVKSLEDFCLRGKLIRGTLFLFTCEMFGRELDTELLNIACAIELIHSSLLIHDDIIDRDYTRRGNKTVFADFIDRGKKINASDPLHYGISVGVVAGDTAFFLAMELISNYNHDTLSALLKFYSNEIYLVTLAEGLDSEFGQSLKEPSEEDIYSIYKYKTARYTFSLPFVMAGIVGKADSETIKQLDILGEKAGIIFQYKDDEIGLFGNEEKIGKPVGGDIRENKKTIIRALLYKMAGPEEKELLNTSFGNNNVTLDQINEIKQMANNFGILHLLNENVEKIMKEIWLIFEKLQVDKTYKETLKDLLEFNLQRTY